MKVVQHVACTIGGVLVSGFVYVLSLGQVLRYGGNPTPPVPPATSAVMYPRWVSGIYSPALHVFAASNEGGLYHRYVAWWFK